MPDFERNHINRMLAGKGSLALSLLATLVIAIISAAMFSPGPLEGHAGICLPSPNEWKLPGGLSFVLNILLYWIACLGAISLNKRFNFIPGSGVLFASVFMFAALSDPWLNSRLSSSSIVVCVVLACCHLLFGLYGRRNASQEIFFIFSILSWGSMIQYSCVLLMPIFMLGAIFLKVFGVRECLAAILAILTPYWIIFGLGVLPAEALRWPGLTNFFTGFAGNGQLYWLLVANGITATLFLLLLAANSLKAYSLGVRMRALNSFLNLLGIAMIWFMLFDTDNLLAYAATLALAFGFQAGRFFPECRLRRAYLLILLIPVIYITLFIFSLS